MDIEHFERGAPNQDVVAALNRDGAAVVRDQVSGDVADSVLLPHCINYQLGRVPPGPDQLDPLPLPTRGPSFSAQGPR